MKVSTCLLIIAYNRPFHLNKILNEMIGLVSKDLPLFISIDGPKKKSDIHLVKKCEEVCKEFSNFIGFEYFKNSTNLGLRKNVIGSINKVFENYNSIIVLEDDLSISQVGIYWAKKALNKYKNIKEVNHINLWTPPNVVSKTDYFTRYMNCWGWATWKDRWVDFNLIDEIKNDIPDNLKKDFNWNGSNLEQLRQNSLGLNKTWAVFWSKHIFQKKGLCLNPQVSFVKNLGFDQFSTNTRYNKLMNNQKISFVERDPDEINLKISDTNEIKIREFCKIFKKNMFLILLSRILKYIGIKEFLKKLKLI